MKYLIIIFISFPLLLKAQKDTSVNKIKNLHGDIISTGGTKNVYNNQKLIVYNKITEKNKDKILLVNKYIDTTKPIIIHCGGNSMITNIKSLKVGFTPIHVDGKNLLKLKVQKGKILFSCTTFSIDGTYIAKMENNRLLNSEENEQYSSEKWIEVISKNDIPVLQVVLNKDDNSISVYGLFFTDNHYIIFSKKGMLIKGFQKPFLLMTEQEKNNAFYLTLTKARQELDFLHDQ